MRRILPMLLLLAPFASGRIMALAPGGQIDLPPPRRDRAWPLPATLWDSERGAPAGGESERARQSLLAVAASYASKTYVPYVWGGNAIGDAATCNACRACVGGKRHLRVERRLRACGACRACGLDCSHFVHRLYQEAGLPLPYLSTSKLKRLAGPSLKASNLIDVGRDLAKARPGDLVVTAHHVILLLGLRGEGFGDFIHVSRSIKRGRIGGIELARNRDILHYRGRIVRILRHVKLDGPAPAAPIAAPTLAPLWHGERMAGAFSVAPPRWILAWSGSL